MTLHFTRAVHKNGLVEYYAIDAATDTLYQAIRTKHFPGWLGLVTNANGELLRRVDWTDHRVHIGEMQSHLVKMVNA